MDKIKLPRSSYEEIVKIINAYGALNKPCSLDDIVQASGTGKTVVSANNAFLALIEIIEGGNKKAITVKGLELSRALEHHMEGNIREAWSEIINENDFLTKMVQAVKIRKGMEIGQLENHIAFSSGEKKSGPVKTGARAVVDILLSSGILIQNEDKIIYSGNQSNNNFEIEESETSTVALIRDQKATDTTKVPVSQNIYGTGISINIDLSIQVKPSELEDLGQKIKRLIKDITEEE